MAKTGIIFAINGPIVKTSNDSGFEMHEMVYVGEENLVGEVIGLTTDATVIEVYEETGGLKPGENSNRYRLPRFSNSCTGYT